ncbi:putative F-box/FBD/LRR-repeat protein At4g00315 [Lycium ferocissimum]|uniref:putative F-box/FBD/LRR-repeat protein At4g00315 n=1 Tax=Lycium ferocissimum TaxID=112874 RepID=UPI002815DD54|nr:putative F-box/FBD/LRR-repeat protein At4g00315 [Lycium ferocissimum]
MTKRRRRTSHPKRKSPKDPKTKAHEFGGRQDIISNLPIEIIRQIHSLLPLKDAARISILSHLWRNIWVSNPNIHLDETDFGANFYKYSDTDKDKRDAFLIYLQKSLVNRHKCEYDCAVDTLYLRITVEDSIDEFLVENWIDFALQNKVKTLRLILRTTYSEWFELCNIEFIAATLVELKLEYCEIIDCSFMLPSLKSLFLDDVCIDDDDFNDLIAGCPRIEKLEIVCPATVCTMVLSNPRLKFFGLHFPCCDSNVLIESKNLETLEFSFVCECMCEVEITYPTTVRELSLQDSYNLESTLLHYINKFPLLEKLVLPNGTCSCIQVSHQHLTNFVVNVLEEVEEVRIDAPKLKSFEYTGGLMLFTGIEASRELEFVHLHLNPEMLNDDWYICLRDMLESFAHSKHLRLICKNEQDIIFPNEITDILLPTINDLENLELQIESSTATSQQIIDGFAWILPRLKTLSLTLGSISKLIEFPDRRREGAFNQEEKLEHERICGE